MQAYTYRGSYSSVTSSGSIRYELGVMLSRLCNEIAMSDNDDDDDELYFDRVAPSACGC